MNNKQIRDFYEMLVKLVDERIQYTRPTRQVIGYMKDYLNEIKDNIDNGDYEAAEIACNDLVEYFMELDDELGIKI